MYHTCANYSSNMSLQTSLDSYFKTKGNAKQHTMPNKNKSTKRSLSLTRSPRQVKTPKKSSPPPRKLEAEEVICLSSSSEDFLTPPERKPHSNVTSSLSTDCKEFLTLQSDINSSKKKSIASPNTSTDSSSTVIYSISPKKLSKSPKTPKSVQSPRSGKKFFSPTKKRIVTNKSPAKRSLVFDFKENYTQQGSTEENVYNKELHFNYQDDKSKIF